MIGVSVENRTFLKAMRHCLDMHCARSDDRSETALLLALHRAGYSAALIEKNRESLMRNRSTTS